jgi:hypothetical protein
MRHALGVLGVLAASVLLVVSAAMNWRFGYSLGHSELDSQLLGLASAASDCLKALIPFFLFAALRNKQWSQAAAAGLLWAVCLTFSFASAIGFSAINRADTSGLRAAEAAVYGDMKVELDKTREKLSWVPQHRPAGMVEQEVEVLKQNKRWASSTSCTNATSGYSKAFCGQYHTLLAELGAAQEADKLQTRVDEIRGKLATSTSGVALASADPQVDALSNLSGQNKALIQTGLILMVALLVELGSSLGFYVVFSNWKIYEDKTMKVPARKSNIIAQAIEVVAPVMPVVSVDTEVPALPLVASANDNLSKPAARLQAPEGNVARYYKENVVASEGANLTASELYEDYTNWCNDNGKEPEALTTFGRDLSELGVQKIKFNGKMRYIGIKVPGREREATRYSPEKVANAA